MKLKASPQLGRAWVARGFTLVEDIVYLGLGVLLTGCSLALLISGAVIFSQDVTAGVLQAKIVPLLDRILLVLLVVRLLYNVQVSFESTL